MISMYHVNKKYLRTKSEVAKLLLCSDEVVERVDRRQHTLADVVPAQYIYQFEPLEVVQIVLPGELSCFKQSDLDAFISKDRGGIGTTRASSDDQYCCVSGL
jgi:hypothetical protein